MIRVVAIGLSCGFAFYGSNGTVWRTFGVDFCAVADESVLGWLSTGTSERLNDDPCDDLVEQAQYREIAKHGDKQEQEGQEQRQSMRR